MSPLNFAIRALLEPRKGQWRVDDLDTDAQHNNLIIGITWTLTAITIIVTILRFISRAEVTKVVSWEDWVMGLATVRFSRFPALLPSSSTPLTTPYSLKRFG